MFGRKEISRVADSKVVRGVESMVVLSLIAPSAVGDLMLRTPVGVLTMGKKAVRFALSVLSPDGNQDKKL